MNLNNNITQDFYEEVNKVGSNPVVLVVLIFILVIYYVIFSLLGNSSESSGGFVFIKAILWAVLILLVFMNGLAYFFNINVVTELKNLFNENPEIRITSNPDTTMYDVNDIGKEEKQTDPKTVLDTKEVYHVPGNKFTYHDAKAVCNAFDGELASYNELKDAQKKGASWCSYGWTKDQLGLYPTSQSTWDKLQDKEGQEYSCGLPGVNGGYVSNPHIKLGSNCYGYKPKISDLESNLLKQKNINPKTEKEKLFDARVDYWKNRVSNILISPFNNDNWFKVPSV
jgi:hypothetical protein